jgi:signal peptidase II
VASYVNTTLIAIAVVATNQATAAAAQIAGPRSFAGVTGLGPTRNTGSVLGFAQGQAVWIAIAIAGVCVSLALARLVAHRCGTVALGLLAGGAIANTLQRLTVGGVADYFVAGVSRINLAFNLADVALVVGGALAARALAESQRSSRPARASKPTA